MNSAKDIGLFFAAPFIGLAYVIAFPIWATWNLYWTGVNAYKKQRMLKPRDSG